MLRRSFAVLAVLALIWTISLNAQKIVDINSAPETEIAAVGIDRAVAKKIVDARPYRNKRDLLTRNLLTMDQYEKIKDLIVARQPAKK
jgi:competence protein ComEA